MGKIRSSRQAAHSGSSPAYAISPAHEAPLLLWGRLQARHGPRRALCATDDALAYRVHRLINGAAFSPLLRDVLRERYVVQAHPLRTCARLGLHQAAYGQWVWRAVAYFNGQWSDRL